MKRKEEPFGFQEEEAAPLTHLPDELYCSKCRKLTPIHLMKSNQEGIYFCHNCKT